MPQILPRYYWKARDPKSAPTHVPISARQAVCVHHDGDKPVVVRSIEQACALMRKDQNYHMDPDGLDWDDIGYNYLVISAFGYPADGIILEGRGADVVGAHCKNWNTPWIGVQVAVGGGQRPSDAALYSTRWLTDFLSDGAGHALAKKVHKDGFNTACPDVFLTNWVRAGMPVGTAVPVKVAVVNVVKAVAKVPAKIVAMATGNLVVDGDFGLKTRKRLQQWAGVGQDGVLGPLSWKAIQRRAGVTPVDGAPGLITWRGVQRLIGAKVDGRPGKLTIMALQRYLNTH